MVFVSDIIPTLGGNGVELLLTIGFWWGNAEQKTRDVFGVWDDIRQKFGSVILGWLAGAAAVCGFRRMLDYSIVVPRS